MSGVSIYIHYAGGKYVLASDYDRDTQALKDDLAKWRDLAKETRIERDALRAQIEVMRVALESIATIEDELYGGDWEEIELARDIASAALQTKP